MHKTIARKLAILLTLVVLVTTCGADYNSIPVSATSEETDLGVQAGESTENDYSDLFTESIGDEQRQEGASEESAQEEVTEPAEEVAPVEENTETPAEEVAPVEENTETPAEEVAPVEENTETPAEEVAPVEENTETPAEEVAPAEENTDTPAEEVTPAEENTEAPAEDAAPAEEVAPAEGNTEEVSTETTESVEKEVKEVTVTYTVSKGGTVSKTSETIDLNAEGAVFEGSTATPWNDKYEFVNWTDANDNEVSTEATFVPSNIEENATFKANFKAAEGIEVDMPELSAEDVHEGGMVVSVKAEEGIFPAGTEVSITAISDDQALETAQNELGDQVTTAKGVDITFKFEGQEIQPADEKYVHVSLALEEAMDAENVTVLHDHEGEVDTIEATVNENTEGDVESVEFDSKEFSIYIVAGSKEENRLRVQFYNGTNCIAEMLVKQKDTETDNNYKTVLYDPGVGTFNDDETFRGWTTVENYERDTTSYSIDEVRDYVKTLLPPDKDADAAGATAVKFYAMFLKQYRVNYFDTHNVSLGEDFVDISANAEGVALEREYTVDMAYTPEDEHHDFQGWFVKPETASHIITKDGSPYVYKEGEALANGTKLTIKGDVTFTVNAPEGHWLIFEKNGNGANYVAPQFIYKDDKDESKTKPTRPLDENMKRNGYSFVDWYEAEYETVIDASGNTKLVPKKDADGNVVLQSTPFNFNQKLAKTTTIYAKWDPNATAPYTILIYKENLKGELEFAESYTGVGLVGSSIKETAIEALKINDMDYVLLGTDKDVEKTGEKTKFGGIQSVPSGTVSDPFTGYTFDASKTTDQNITAEGDAICKIVFKPMEYNFKFYLAKRDGDAIKASFVLNANGDKRGDWHWTFTHVPKIDGVELPLEEGYYAHTITAKYGADISSQWISYGNITSDMTFVSWLLMGTAKAYTGVDKGRDTIKGMVGIMDEQILGDLTTVNGNYVTARYENGVKNWRYEIYIKDENGEYTYKDTKYAYDHVVEAKSAQTGDGSQHSPAIEGYECIGEVYSGKLEGYNNTWGMKYYYDPLSYPICYMDGTYVDSYNNLLPIGTAHQLFDPVKVEYNATLTDESYYKVPSPSEDGFVFEGWFSDSGCTHKFEYEVETGKDESGNPITKKYLGENASTRMTTSGITVYAKWRRVEYRVFLHPNAGTKETDPGLTWGKSEESAEEPSMCFKVAYGSKVSAPTGMGRAGYEFVGWFLDPSFSKPFNADAYALNDDNTFEYNKSDKNNYTDDMDKWGNGATYNKDARENRWWVTRKLDIYGKWRKVVDGADGINVAYSPLDTDILVDGKPIGEGITVPTDTKLYVDDADAYAMPASKAPTGYEFKCWVMQKWNGEKYVDVMVDGKLHTINPGTSYKVLVDNAKQVIDTAHSTPEKTRYIYTVQLRAKYVMPDKATPTYIPWFENDGTEAFQVDVVEDGKNKLGINEAVNIQPKPTNAVGKEYSEFLGWAKVPMSSNPDNPEEAAEQAKAFMEGSANWTQNLTEANFIFYNEADGKFYADAAFTKEAKQVAADEAMPYQALFAVWKINEDVPIVVTIEGNTSEVYYNGKDQSVEGYVVKSITVNDKPFTGITAKDIELVDGVEAKRTEKDVLRNASGDIDNYWMGLNGTPEKTGDPACSFKCTNTTYKNVTFVVKDGYLKINPLELKVEVIGNRGEELYDGTEKRVTGYTLNAISAVSVGAGIPDAKDFFDEKKVEFTGEDVAKGIQPGTYPMNLAVSQFSYDDPNIDVTFEVIDGQLIIRDVPEAGKLHVIARTPDREEMYSGKTWVGSDFDYSVEGKVANEGIITSALKSLGSFIGINAHAEDGTKEITINNEKYYVSGLRVDVNARSVGKYPLDIVNEGFKVVDVNGQDVTDKFDDPEFIIGTLTITPKPIELTSGSAEKVYDATPLVYHVANANTEWGIGDAVTYNFTGSQTEVGTSKNTFAAVPANDLTDFKNYIITYVYGDLTVTKSSDSNPPDDDKKNPDKDKKKTTESDKKRDDEGDSTNDNSSNDNGGNNDNVLGARRNPPATGDNAAVLGAKRTRGEEPGVLGARRGGTEDSTNTSRIIVLLIAAGAVVTLLITGRKRKKDEE